MDMNLANLEITKSVDKPSLDAKVTDKKESSSDSKFKDVLDRKLTAKNNTVSKNDSDKTVDTKKAEVVKKDDDSKVQDKKVDAQSADSNKNTPVKITDSNNDVPVRDNSKNDESLRIEIDSLIELIMTLVMNSDEVKNALEKSDINIQDLIQNITKAVDGIKEILDNKSLSLEDMIDALKQLAEKITKFTSKFGDDKNELLAKIDDIIDNLTETLTDKESTLSDEKVSDDNDEETDILMEILNSHATAQKISNDIQDVDSKTNTDVKVTDKVENVVNDDSNEGIQVQVPISNQEVLVDDKTTVIEDTENIKVSEVVTESKEVKNQNEIPEEVVKVTEPKVDMKAEVTSQNTDITEPVTEVKIEETKTEVKDFSSVKDVNTEVPKAEVIPESNTISEIKPAVNNENIKQDVQVDVKPQISAKESISKDNEPMKVKNNIEVPKGNEVQDDTVSTIKEELISSTNISEKSTEVKETKTEVKPEAKVETQEVKTVIETNKDTKSDNKNNNPNSSNENKQESSNLTKEDNLLKSLTDDSDKFVINRHVAVNNDFSLSNAAPVNKEFVINEATFTEDIIKNVKYIATNDLKELTVKINPNKLGEMTISMIQEDGFLKANLKATTKEAYDLISRNLNEVTKVLEEQNIKIQKVDVTLENNTGNNQNSNQNNANAFFDMNSFNGNGRESFKSRYFDELNNTMEVNPDAVNDEQKQDNEGLNALV